MYYCYYYQNLDSVSKTAQLGTVIEGRTEFFSGRIPKKQRKQTLVDEILADKDIRSGLVVVVIIVLYHDYDYYYYN